MAAILNQPHFQDPDAARVYLEAQVWPNGRICPHCGTIGDHYELKGKSNRPGLYKCADCREPFTVTVGTLFERSKVGLHLWLQAVYLMAASKKGISAKQLERMLGVTYKTAWFMSHRIREAMNSDKTRLLGGSGTSGVVEADETYWGTISDDEGNKTPIKTGVGHKMKIVSLVERDGSKRSFHVANVTADTAQYILRNNVHQSAHVMTDESNVYKRIGKNFAIHSTVNHSANEYARGTVTTNTVESSFALLKRGLHGTFHSVSEKHLQRYCTEFDFRWNTRQSQGWNDSMRADLALKGITGKRLTYRRISFVTP